MAEEVHERGSRMREGLSEREERKNRRTKEELKQRKALKEYMEMLLSGKPDAETRKALREMGFRMCDINNAAALNMALFDKAMNGDSTAYKTIRDLVGESADKMNEETLAKAAALLEGVDSAF